MRLSTSQRTGFAGGLPLNWLNEMRYQVQFGDSGLHAIAGIHSALIESLDAHFGDAEAVMRAYARCVAAVGIDTRIPPAVGAPEIDHLVTNVWVQGEFLAIKRALDALWPGMNGEVSQEVIGNSFLVLSPEAGPTEFDLPLPFDEIAPMSAPSPKGGPSLVG